MIAKSYAGVAKYAYFLFAIYFFIAIAIFFFSVTGGCLRDLRYFTKRELLAIAVLSQLREDEKNISSKATDVESFLRLYPNCCLYYERKESILSKIYRTFGCDGVTIEIRYNSIVDGYSRKMVALYEIDSCGDIISRESTYI